MTASKHILHPIDELWYKDTYVDTIKIEIYVRRCNERGLFYVEYSLPAAAWSAKSADGVLYVQYEDAKEECLFTMQSLKTMLKSLKRDASDL